jgi:hypothetical protein
LLWQEPLDLSLIRGTPFNCLAIDPASTPPTEAALADARRAGFDVVAPGAAPVTLLGDCSWPRVVAGGKDGAASGPTGLPWIESNGWRIRLALAMNSDKPIWIRHGKLPEKTALPLPPEAYALAVADAAAHGGKWIVELDAELRRGLAAREQRAVATWRQMVSTVAFFELHPAWASMRPQGVLGVISDFAGENEFVGTELLNLLSRRQVGYRIIPAHRAIMGETRGLNALLYAAQTAPSRDLMVLFVAFARAGGLVILPAAAASSVPPGVAEADVHTGFNLRGVGQGRIAVAKHNWDDPYAAARDVHVLLSRRHDHVHLFNASSMSSHATVSPGGASAVVHLLNYSMRAPASPVTLAVRERYRESRLWMPGASGPVALKMTGEADWIEMPLPPFSVYAAIELSA